MNSHNPIFADLAALSRKADSEMTIYLPDSNTEATGYFLLDRCRDAVFAASLIGILTDDAVLTNDQAVEQFGLAQVAAWERAAVAQAQESGE